MAEQIKLYNEGHSLQDAVNMSDQELRQRAEALQSYLEQPGLPERQIKEAMTYLGRISFEMSLRCDFDTLEAELQQTA